jgi:cyclic-di-GMP-binding protein
MPSFDIVSELDAHEITNAIDQSNREVSTRFDFKGTEAEIQIKDFEVTLIGNSPFQLQQLRDILNPKLAKRGVDLQCLKIGEPEGQGKTLRQKVTLRQGIDTPTAKDIVKYLKESKLKVQAQIQGEQVRVTGKKRDDLQDAIATLRKGDFGLPLQFTNFRD